MCASAPTLPSARARIFTLIRQSLNSRRAENANPKETIMLYTIAVVLIVLWLLGMVTTYTMGGFIHILLVIAVIVILLRVISGRSPL
jgi:hypothetical protein